MLLRPRDLRDAMPESEHCRAHGKIAQAVAEIPIYRCPVEEHIRRMRDHEERIRDECKCSEYITNTQLAHFAAKYWTGWRYNEVIGWLRIYAYPLQGYVQHPMICAEFYGIDAQRLSTSLKRKRYLFDGEAFAIVVDESVVRNDVFTEVTRAIRRWSDQPGLRAYNLDLEVWESIGPRIGWAGLLSRVDTGSGAKLAPT